MKQTINGADFRRLVISAAAAIEINKQKLNELNVFPVPDGDTGTNMSMTINAAANDLRKVEDPTLEQAGKTTASAMLRGANRGRWRSYSTGCPSFRRTGRRWPPRHRWRCQ